MRLRTIAILALGFVLAAEVKPALSYQFTPLGESGGWKDQPVTIVFDESDYTLDLSANRVDAALGRAFDTWADADTKDKLSFDRRSDNDGNYDVFDGSGGSLDQSADWLYANIAVGGWLPPSYFDSLAPDGGAGILAVSITAKLRGGGSKKPRYASNIFVNDGFKWSDNPIAGEYDIETVALHEAGHSIGLDHEDIETSVMASFYDGIERSLYPDDLAGLAAIYGKGGGGGGGGGRGGGGGGPPGGNGPPGRNLGIGDDLAVTGITLVDGFSVDFATAFVPEPSTLVLALLSLCCLTWFRRERV